MAKLGSGERFAAVKKQAAGWLKGKKIQSKKYKTREEVAAAIAAKVGQEKYGKKKMAQLAAAGRKRKRG